MRLAWIAAPVVGVAACLGAMAWSAPDDRNTGGALYDQLDLFGQVVTLVEREYVTEINAEEAMEGAINGMLSSLDPHSSYMNAQAYRDMQVQIRGEYGGLWHRDHARRRRHPRRLADR